MQCPNCGEPISPDTAFCPRCGMDLRAITQPQPPQQPSPQAPPPPPPGFQPTAVMPQVPPPPPPGAYGAATPPPPMPGQPKKKLSTGAVVGITIAAVLGALIVLVGLGFAGYALFVPKVVTTVGQASTLAPEPEQSASASSSSDAQSTGSESAAADGSSSSSDSADAAGSSSTSDWSAKDELVTDAQAREIVQKFWDLRIAHDISGSKALCSQKLLKSDDGTFVSDKYWRPDSFKIVKTTPDQMYIHVAIMGQWPSGDEPVVLSVTKDPETGKVVIDGLMVDPEKSLYK